MRIGIAAAAAWTAVLAGGAAASAQEAAPADPPATVGPRELQDFSLQGTVTRQAEPPAERASSPTPSPVSQAVRPQASAAEVAAPATRGAETERQASRSSPSEESRASPSRSIAAAPSQDRAGNLARFEAPAAASGPPMPVPTTVLPAAPALDLGEDPQPTGLPWQLALVLLALAGGGYTLWQRGRGSRLALAGAPGFAFEAPPEPVSRPRAAPPRAAPPRPAPPAAPAGVVSTRLRPWLEIDFKPVRCVMEDDGATIHFEVELFNSGSAPARQVLVEAAMFNAGPSQDEDIGRFFAHPVAKGDRLPMVDVLKRVSMSSAVHLRGDQLRVFEAQGRRFIVPLVGLNAVYSWSGGDAQTSLSYLVGRDTAGEKLAPFRLEPGVRTFTKLGARRNPRGVRR